LKPLVIFLAAGLLTVAAKPAAAQMADCSAEAERIRRAQTELPRLEVAPPGDRQIVCITLETNLLFARRVASHVAKCPRSPIARSGPTWVKTRRDYQAQFNKNGCKTAIKGYRG
jgi:hypothetical protein